MTTFLGAARSVTLDLGGDDDNSDKLSCRYTVSLLIVFCVIISTKQYVGEPIVCWVPATFTASMRDFTDNMCWVKNTYFIPMGDAIPSRDEDVQPKSEVNYYQWVPIILVIQAFLFYLPSLAWQAFNQHAGCDIKNLCKVLTDASMVNAEVRKKCVDSATAHLDKFLSSKRKRSETTRIRRCCTYVWGGAQYGNSVVVPFVLVKLMYIANVIGQIFLLSRFVGEIHENLGFRLLQDLANGKDTKEWERFPRSTLCSFKVREFGGNVHRHTVQCVLTVNLFNEKIYIFLWFWFIFVAVVSSASLVSWLWYFASKSKVGFCKEMLRMSGYWSWSGGVGKDGASDSTIRNPSANGDAAHDSASSAEIARERRGILRDFADHYLRADGIFILRLLRSNVSGLIVSDITAELYKRYEERRCAGATHEAEP